MSEQEALRLADAIDPLTRQSLDNLTCAAAAAELRRLVAERQRDGEVMQRALDQIIEDRNSLYEFSTVPPGEPDAKIDEDAKVHLARYDSLIAELRERLEK